MKNNKKGFTFVELLAVIVVLGIVMSIAITATVEILNRSKKKSSKISAKSYVTAINDYNQISTPSERIKASTSGCSVAGANIIRCKAVSITPIIKKSITGTLPTSGDIYIDLNTNKVTSASLKIRGYIVSYTTNANGNGKYVIN